MYDLYVYIFLCNFLRHVMSFNLYWLWSFALGQNVYFIYRGAVSLLISLSFCHSLTHSLSPGWISHVFLDTVGLASKKLSIHHVADTGSFEERSRETERQTLCVPQLATALNVLHTSFLITIM